GRRRRVLLLSGCRLLRREEHLPVAAADLARGGLEAACAQHLEQRDRLEAGEQAQALAGRKRGDRLHDDAEGLSARPQDRPDVEIVGRNAQPGAPVSGLPLRGGRNRRGRAVPWGRRIPTATLARRRASTSSTAIAAVAASVAADARRKMSARP